ncbi:MAG: LytTR family transcriptional regulator [Clostridiales Family XIII bacterium]|jgi:DNA-binding LytR/AlgR family response regulator|nr:LytTR family transcriptional regulator [Clostridiales Family XIII bacterium]
MNIRIDIDDKLSEVEVVIRTPSVNDDALEVQNAVLKALSGLAEKAKLRLTKGEKDFYLPVTDIIFFESDGGKTFAHTAGDVFEVKMRLYELEEILPSSFIRVSKSAIIGVKEILSIEKNPVGPSMVGFRNSHKRLSVSRQYYKILQDKLGGHYG